MPTQLRSVLLRAAVLLVLANGTVTILASRAIEVALPAPPGARTWLVTAYSLGLGAVLLVAPRLADLLGHRSTLLAGSLVFAAASLAAGLTDAPATLVALRAVEGVAGAAILSATMAGASSARTGVSDAPSGAPHRAPRSRAAVLVGLGAVGGLAAGAALTQWFGWRWVFLAPLPLAAALAALSPWLVLRSVRSVTRPDPARLGAAGTAVLAVVGLSRVEGHGWPDRTGELFLAAAAGLLIGVLAYSFRAVVARGAAVTALLGAGAAGYVLCAVGAQHGLDGAAPRVALQLVPFAGVLLLAGYAVARRPVPGPVTIVGLAQLGGAVGLALAAAVAAHTTEGRLRAGLVERGVRPELLTRALSAGYDHALTTTAILLAVAAVITAAGLRARRPEPR